MIQLIATSTGYAILDESIKQIMSLLSSENIPASLIILPTEKIEKQTGNLTIHRRKIIIRDSLTENVLKINQLSIPSAVSFFVYAYDE